MTTLEVKDQMNRMTEEHISDAQGDDLRPCEERNREEGEEDIDHGQDKDWTQYFNEFIALEKSLSWSVSF